MICFDREFPESRPRAHARRRGGAADAERVPAARRPRGAVPRPRLREHGRRRDGQLRAPSRTPTPDDHDAYDGRSVAFSGIAFDPDGRPLDHTLVEAGRDEQIALARFDLDALREHRAREVWGDAYRRPGAYAALVADTPAATGVRPRGRAPGGRARRVDVRGVRRERSAAAPGRAAAGAWRSTCRPSASAS